MVRVFQPQLAAQVHQAAEVLVRRVGTHEHLADDDEIIAGAVPDEDVAVAVQNFAAAAVTRVWYVTEPLGAGSCSAGLRDLHIVQGGRRTRPP